MKFLLEFKSFLKEGDNVLIEYWYNDMVTPVKIVEKISKVSYKVSHNVPNSKFLMLPMKLLSLLILLILVDNVS